MHAPVILETLADLARYRYGLTAHCERCSRSEAIDLAAMIQAGRGALGYVGLRVRCSGCGSLGRLQLAPPTVATSAYPVPVTL